MELFQAQKPPNRCQPITHATGPRGGLPFNSSPPGQNDLYLADDIFKCIFANEKFCILIKIPLKIVPKGQLVII